MAYVEGELGKKIEELMDESFCQYKNGDYEKAINLLIEAYDELPDGKNEYDESYLIVWRILDIAIKAHMIDIMNQWVDKIFYADLERIDSGEREMWAGRVAYESGDMKKAKEYIKIANKKSHGRCFSEKDKKYRELLIQ